MKIILSRKGFDSAAGKVASPIFPSGEMRSLPIPQPDSFRLANPIRYGQIAMDGRSLGDLVADLTRGKITPDRAAHLDPDLDALSLPRQPHWRPIFGQVGAAEQHLQNQGVGERDVFVFYGWFRRVEQSPDGYRYVRDAPDLHVIFGWLQIERSIPLTSRSELPLWALYHPHCQYTDPSRPESLYLSTPSLQLPGIETSAPGAGVFRRFSSGLCLTARGQSRSIWRLPRWMYPREGGSGLTYNENTSRWTMDGDTVLLHSAERGQEFVLDCEDYPEAIQWLSQLVPLSKM